MDQILPTRGDFFAEPSGAALLEGLEYELGFAHEAEAVADRELVEGEEVGVVVGVVAVQGCLDLFADGVGEGDAACVFFKKGVNFRREESGVGDEQLPILLLPFMAVGLHLFVFQVRLQMGSLVEEDPEEEVWVEVAVDADFVESMVGTWPSVIPQLRHPLAGDVKMDFVEVQIVIYPIHRRSRQMIA